MVDLLVHLIAWCQSCVPDTQSAPPPVGIIGGTAGAIGAIGGLVGSGASSASTADATAPSDAESTTSPAGGDASSSGDDGGDDSGSDGGNSDGLAEPPSSFNDTTGGFQMHEAPDPPEFPDDPFHSPSGNPQPIFSDGGQVDGSNKPGDDTTETDYINPDGTPLGSTPPAPHHAPVAPPHKPK